MQLCNNSSQSSNISVNFHAAARQKINIYRNVHGSSFGSIIWILKIFIICINFNIHVRINVFFVIKLQNSWFFKIMILFERQNFFVRLHLRACIVDWHWITQYRTVIYCFHWKEKRAEINNTIKQLVWKKKTNKSNDDSRLETCLETYIDLICPVIWFISVFILFNWEMVITFCIETALKLSLYTKTKLILRR